MNLKYFLAISISALIAQCNIIETQQQNKFLNKLLINADESHLNYNSLLLTSPLENHIPNRKLFLDSEKIVKNQKTTKISDNFEQFLMSNPLEKQNQQERKLGMMESKSENRKFNSQQMIENNLDTYLSQLTIDVQKSEVIDYQSEAESCSGAFLDVFRKSHNKNYDKPTEFVAKQEQKTCPDITKTCCKLLQYQKFVLMIRDQRNKVKENFKYLEYVIMILDSMNEDNLELLLDEQEEMTYQDVENELEQEQQISQNFQQKRFMSKRERIPECSERLSDVKILMKKYQQIRQKRYKYKKMLQDYYNMIVEDYFDTLCSLCDGDYQDFFKLNLYTFKYDIIINLPQEFTRFYEKIFKVQKFLPLIAFSNIYKCLTVPDHKKYLQEEKFLQSRDIEFQYLNSEDLRDYREWDLYQILDEQDYINYFEENYAPGRYLNFSFKNVFHNLYPLLPEYKQKLIPRPELQPEEDIFGNWVDILEIDQQKKIITPEFTPDSITLKYSNTDGFWAGQNKYQMDIRKKTFLQFIQNRAFGSILVLTSISLVLFNQN